MSKVHKVVCLGLLCDVFKANLSQMSTLELTAVSILFLCSCDYNKYSLQYLLSLAENKRKRPIVTETSHSDSDSDDREFMMQSDSEDNAEFLIQSGDMDT